MEVFLRKKGVNQNADAIADEIHSVAEALSRLIENDYCAPMFENVRKKWGKLQPLAWPLQFSVP